MKIIINKINENSYIFLNCGIFILIREEFGDYITFEEIFFGIQGLEMFYLDGSLWNIFGYLQIFFNMIGRC